MKNEICRSVPHKWITLITIPTFADSSWATFFALGIHSARTGQTRVESTWDKWISFIAISENEWISKWMSLLRNKSNEVTNLHRHTALAPWDSQSALAPQGPCEQGSSLHLTNGSPLKPLGHLQMALAPVFSHSAFIPQGSWSQGFTWQFE